MAPSKSGRTNWTSETHLDLLLAIMEHAAPTQAEWDNIIKQLRGQGYNFSIGAATQHLGKLRAKESVSNGSSDAGNGTAPSTPTPKKTAGKGTKKTPGNKRKAKQPVVSEDEVEDDSSPTKKIKKEKFSDDDQENGDTKGPSSSFGGHDDEV
ncbi:hypothetical protein F4810DRAFT_689550 [Camillea tinctor]|nr:hypothetical protein F4810DRAFT_689550 [Camillea tinctor]